MTSNLAIANPSPMVDTQWFALGTALTAFDAAATWLWLTLGVATEANPVVRSLIDAHGLALAMGLRAIIGVGLFAGFRLLATRSNLARRANLAATGLLAALATYHVAMGTRVLVA